MGGGREGGGWPHTIVPSFLMMEASNLNFPDSLNMIFLTMESFNLQFLMMELFIGFFFHCLVIISSLPILKSDILLGLSD